MLEIKGISKLYGDQIAVDNLSLDVKKGEVFGFLGPNGAGKTTAIKIMVGINKPDSGSVTIDGLSPDEISVREKLGFKPEEPHFYGYLTGLELLRFAGQLFNKSYNLSDKDYVEILKTVGLGDVGDKRINHYSKGMRQRLGFAQAIVNDPDYLFIDEPLEGLDPIGRRELKVIVRKLKNSGKTIFLNSHILSDIEELCDSIGIINLGRLVYSGSVFDFCLGKNLEERFVEEIEKINK